MVEWWAWIVGVIVINILVIVRFLAWRKFKIHTRAQREKASENFLDLRESLHFI